MINCQSWLKFISVKLIPLYFESCSRITTVTIGIHFIGHYHLCSTSSWESRGFYNLKIDLSDKCSKMFLQLKRLSLAAIILIFIYLNLYPWLSTLQFVILSSICGGLDFVTCRLFSSCTPFSFTNTTDHV